MRRRAAIATSGLILAACGGNGLSAEERKRADAALGAIRGFCQTGSATVFAHGGRSPEEDRRLHASRRGVETLLELYRDKPDARYDPPGSPAPAKLRAVLDRLSRQLRFCDVEATDTIVRELEN